MHLSESKPGVTFTLKLLCEGHMESYVIETLVSTSHAFHSNGTMNTLATLWERKYPVCSIQYIYSHVFVEKPKCELLDISVDLVLVNLQYNIRHLRDYKTSTQKSFLMLT